jgi:hypothetical protein
MMRVSIVGRGPKRDGLYWKIPVKWMMKWGTPMLGNLPIYI